MPWLALKEEIKREFEPVESQEEHLYQTYLKFLVYKKDWYSSRTPEQVQKAKESNRKYVAVPEHREKIRAAARAKYQQNVEASRAYQRSAYRRRCGLVSS